MIPTSDIFEAAQRNPEVYYMNYLGGGLYTLQMEDDRNNGILPQKMNSYGVLKVIDPTWYSIQFAPRNLTEEELDEDDMQCTKAEKEYYDDLDICDTVLE
tara:strand:- start:798 stop:1097 length:300 start_codon:yes stop_codon:yes gene_type:complete